MQMVIKRSLGESIRWINFYVKRKESERMDGRGREGGERQAIFLAAHPAAAAAI